MNVRLIVQEIRLLGVSVAIKQLVEVEAFVAAGIFELHRY